MQQERVINAVKSWLEHIVIGLNFCPFANKPFMDQSIRYVCFNGKINEINTFLLKECAYLTNNPSVETTLIIFPEILHSFSSFITQIKSSNQFLNRKNLINTYQLAHFHPQYLFDNSTPDAASNYTNRSPYPILHIIRQESLTKALKPIKNPHLIPQNNIKMAEQKGVAFFENFLLNLKNS